MPADTTNKSNSDHSLLNTCIIIYNIVQENGSNRREKKLSQYTQMKM